jgi:hypothetical protein
MIEVRGAESLRNRLSIFDGQAELKPGDEVLILVTGSPDRKQEEYGLAVRLTDKPHPGAGPEDYQLEEGEVVVEYRDRVFIGQKIPEFI